MMVVLKLLWAGRNTVMITAAILTVMSAFVLHIRYIDRLETERDALRTERDALSNTVDIMVAERRITEMVVEQRDIMIEAIRSDQVTARRRLDELRESDHEVDEFLNLPVPSALNRLRYDTSSDTADDPNTADDANP